MTAHDSARTGAAIRKLRLAKGLTLAELSVATGVPLSTLSRVELGQNALKFDKLMRICRALEVDLQGLVAREADTSSLPSGRRSVSRAGEGRSLSLGPHVARIAADDLTDRSLTPIYVDVAVASLDAHGPFLTFPQEVFVAVQSGAVTLHSQFYAPLALQAGDGVYLDGRAGLALVAAEGASAQALLTIAGDWRPEGSAA